MPPRPSAHLCNPYQHRFHNRACSVLSKDTLAKKAELRAQEQPMRMVARFDVNYAR